MREDTDDLERAASNRDRDPDRLLGRGDARTHFTARDLDRDTKITASHAIDQIRSAGQRTHADGDDRSLEQLTDPTGLVGAEPDRVGDEDVVDAAGDEDLGLADGRDRQADAARANLSPADLDVLAALRVGPTVDAATTQGRHHGVDVALHRRFDDAHGGRLYRVRNDEGREGQGASHARPATRSAGCTATGSCRRSAPCCEPRGARPAASPVRTCSWNARTRGSRCW